MSMMTKTGSTGKLSSSGQSTKARPPIRENHEAIRLRVVDSVRELIVEGGLGSITIRNVARKLGYSTAIVQHYFSNKHEMMLFVHERTNQIAGVHVEAALRDGPNLLRPLIEAYLPLDEERRVNWLVWIAFWGMAVANSEFSHVQRDGVLDARAVFQKQLAALQAAGLIDAAICPAEAARDMLALVLGVALQAAFDPLDWPAARQRRTLEEYCSRNRLPMANPA